MAGQIGFARFLVQLGRQQAMVGQDGIHRVPVLRSNPQREAAIGGQLAGNRDQQKSDPRLLQHFFGLEDPVDRMEYGDKILIVNHAVFFLEKIGIMS